MADARAAANPLAKLDVPVLRPGSGTTAAAATAAAAAAGSPDGDAALRIAADKALASRLLLGKNKKALGNKLRHRWLRLDGDGETCEVTMSKAAITNRLGVQPRDLRLLDAAPASSPPAVLVRDKAIVVNLEFLKCIITTEYMMVMDSGEERIAAFLQEHRRRLRDPEDWGGHHAPAGGSSDDGGNEEPLKGGGDFRSLLSTLPGITEEAPFELRALDVVLDFVTMFLEYLVTDLERVAHPVLDAIVQKVTMRRLDRLRSVKNRMVRLNTRVETIRELLERLLDDDEDMRDMNLSARARNAAMTEWRATGGTTTPRGAHAVRDFLSRASLRTYDKEEEQERDKDQVEQLLETYFMNLDNTWNRLRTLAEYVEDGEDNVKHEIATQRNRFIEYRLVIQFFMVAALVATNVFNVFTMNLGTTGLDLGVGNSFRDAPSSFTATAVVSVAGSGLLLFLGLAYMRHKRMLMW